ncbi:MAG: hypothetical protein DCC75_09995 [Proteobacteria bacterium]|nr:MAG: hypothetical protein DCC75_09995 [Pseudomonadota bacterium]
MALAIGSEVGKVSEGVGFEGDTPLSSEVLGRIQAGLYSRPSDPGNRGDDAFGLLVGALTGTGSPSNPMEANIRFIEELLRQLAAGENYNFQRAYTTATRW